MKVFFTSLFFSVFAFNGFSMTAENFAGYWGNKSTILHLVAVSGVVNVYEVSTAEDFANPVLLGIAAPQGENLPFLFIPNPEVPEEFPAERIELSVSVEAKEVISKALIGSHTHTQTFSNMTETQALATAQEVSDVFASVTPEGQSGWGVSTLLDENKLPTDEQVPTYCERSANGRGCQARYGRPNLIWGCYFWDHGVYGPNGELIECMDCRGRCGGWHSSSRCVRRPFYSHWQDTVLFYCGCY